ncbi:peptide/nickel transport system permease protein [Barrientosiimonas humi]|uniref:Peptide/nickel transport system permease protein n=1 Tax=Barrientosiimonas humi TaxID=999931 RepID=A0A542XC37_9MICO|nr:ABC transporter permease [Barrientosiimonas humi]TQL33400.1 peptide/nickel transport system permease protein [Barrientosiimonas humi]CAG7573389.1 Dipeptide transport system permease protein DppB [Barrientosiimonas humi]
MLIYLTRRVLLGLSVVLAAIVATFILFFVGPNDPTTALCGRQCTPERAAQIEQNLGLDKPKTEQFTRYVKGLVVGTKESDGGGARDCEAPCLGWSYVQNRSVTDIVKQAFPVTVSVVAGGMVVYSIMGISLGVLCARKRGKWVDKLIVGSSQFISAIPYYILAVIFYLYGMKYTGLVPEATWTPLTQSPWGWFVGLLGVWLFYGAITSTGYIRYIRASMIDTQAQDYVRTARSKGISEFDVTFKHALRAAIAPFVTLLGLGVAAELTGAIFTERVFNLPGMGTRTILAYSQGDLPVIAGIVIVSSVLLVVANIIVDLLYGVVDPRVKLS